MIQEGSAWAGREIGGAIGGERGVFWGNVVGNLLGAGINTGIAIREGRRGGKSMPGGGTRDVATESRGLYDVGSYNQLRYKPIAGTTIHHVPSRLHGRELIADYAIDDMAGKEYAIRLLASEAEAVDAAAKAWAVIPESARQVLAWQIRDLRKFTHAPLSALKRLVALNQARRPYDFLIRSNP